jgi:hypothetical protein
MSTPEPTWNPDAHRERVFQRGRRLRNRRRLATWAGGVVAALVLVAGLAAARGVGGGGAGRQVATAGSSRAAGSAGPSGAAGSPGSSGSTTSVGPLSTAALGTGGGTTVDGGGGTLPGGGTTVPGSGGGSSTTTVPRPRVTTSSTVATASPTSTVPASPGTTTAPGSPCPSSALSWSTVTDAGTYPVGAPVSFQLVATNHSGVTCTGPSVAGIGAKATVTNSSGAVVFTTSAIAISCTSPCNPPVLTPGGTASYGAGAWPNAGPSGSYTATASRLSTTASPALFSVG